MTWLFLLRRPLGRLISLLFTVGLAADLQARCQRALAFVANPDGSKVRGFDPMSSEQSSVPSNVRKLQECISKAKGDPTKLQECTARYAG